MLFDREFISKLGTKSLSKDTAKTLERVNVAWNNASKEKQQEVLELADVKYAIAYRVRKIGTITTKMTIAYSQALDLDPYYLIGAVDENVGYTYAAAKKLMTEIGAGKGVKAFEKAHKPPKPPKKGSPVVEKPLVEGAPVPEKVTEQTLQAVAQKLSEEDMMTLLRGLVIKVGTGNPKAVADMLKITEILLG